MNPHGKKVERIYFSGEGEGQIVVGDGYDTMIYDCENLGSYGIDWVKCYKKGDLVAQYNAQYLLGIEFVEEVE